jgi:ankyrin repeat protein
MEMIMKKMWKQATFLVSINSSLTRTDVRGFLSDGRDGGDAKLSLEHQDAKSRKLAKTSADQMTLSLPAPSSAAVPVTPAGNNGGRDSPDGYNSDEVDVNGDAIDAEGDEDEFDSPDSYHSSEVDENANGPADDDGDDSPAGYNSDEVDANGDVIDAADDSPAGYNSDEVDANGDVIDAGADDGDDSPAGYNSDEVDANGDAIVAGVDDDGDDSPAGYNSDEVDANGDVIDAGADGDDSPAGYNSDEVDANGDAIVAGGDDDGDDSPAGYNSDEVDANGDAIVADDGDDSPAGYNSDEVDSNGDALVAGGSDADTEDGDDSMVTLSSPKRYHTEEASSDPSDAALHRRASRAKQWLEGKLSAGEIKKSIFTACKKGNPKELQLALRFVGAQAHLGEKDSEGRTPILLAMRCQDSGIRKELVRVLLSHKQAQKSLADPFQGEGMLLFPLHQACLNGDLEIVDMMLQHQQGRISISEPDEHGRTPLWCAISRYDDEIVSLMMAHNYEASMALNLKLGVGQRGPLKSFIFAACKNGNTKDLKLALRFAASHALLGEKDSKEEGKSPLILAMQCDNLNDRSELVSILLKHQSAQDSLIVPFEGGGRRLYPLYMACYNGDFEIASMMLQYAQGKSSICEPDQLGRTPLWCASAKGDEAMVTLLMKYEEAAKALHIKSEGFSPFAIACQFRWGEMVLRFLKHKAIVQYVKRATKQKGEQRFKVDFLRFLNSSTGLESIISLTSLDAFATRLADLHLNHGMPLTLFKDCIREVGRRARELFKGIHPEEASEDSMFQLQRLVKLPGVFGNGVNNNTLLSEMLRSEERASVADIEAMWAVCSDSNDVAHAFLSPDGKAATELATRRHDAHGIVTAAVTCLSDQFNFRSRMVHLFPMPRSLASNGPRRAPMRLLPFQAAVLLCAFVPAGPLLEHLSQKPRFARTFDHFKARLKRLAASSNSLTLNCWSAAFGEALSTEAAATGSQTPLEIWRDVDAFNCWPAFGGDGQKPPPACNRLLQWPMGGHKKKDASRASAVGHLPRSQSMKPPKSPEVKARDLAAAKMEELLDESMFADYLSAVAMAEHDYVAARALFRSGCCGTIIHSCLDLAGSLQKKGDNQHSSSEEYYSSSQRMTRLAIDLFVSIPYDYMAALTLERRVKVRLEQVIGAIRSRTKKPADGEGETVLEAALRTQNLAFLSLPMVQRIVISWWSGLLPDDESVQTRSQIVEAHRDTACQVIASLKIGKQLPQARWDKFGLAVMQKDGINPKLSSTAPATASEGSDDSCFALPAAYPVLRASALDRSFKPTSYNRSTTFADTLDDILKKDTITRPWRFFCHGQPWLAFATDAFAFLLYLFLLTMVASVGVPFGPDGNSSNVAFEVSLYLFGVSFVGGEMQAMTSRGDRDTYFTLDLFWNVVDWAVIFSLGTALVARLSEISDLYRVAMVLCVLASWFRVLYFLTIFEVCVCVRVCVCV